MRDFCQKWKVTHSIVMLTYLPSLTILSHGLSAINDGQLKQDQGDNFSQALSSPVSLYAFY